jgi:2-succinyl-6-hydroxy-2,4-cyclohexadiene-1-carboxylate synthase
MSIKFNYSLSGSRDRQIILFLHGFLGDRADFAQVISLLSEQFYCLAVDLPGHGKTRGVGGDESYTMPNTARALVDLLDSLNIERCFLVGYSMGGRLALYLALNFPERFPKIVVESASPGLKNQQERDARIQHDFKLASQLETSDLSSFLANWYNQPLFASLKKHPEFNRIIESKLQNNPFELARALRNLSTGCQPCLWDKLKQNGNPLLLLAGEYDNKFLSINTEMASLCEAARLEIISSCGHNIHFEDVNAFVKQIRQFFS